MPIGHIDGEILGGFGISGIFCPGFLLAILSR
jgi:hypothetical protein